MKRSKVYLLLLISFVLGIVARSFFEVNFFWVYIVALLGLVGLVLEWGNKRIRMVSWGLIFLFLGIARLELADWRTKNQLEDIKECWGEQIVLEGEISREPDERPKNVQLVLNDVWIDNSKIRGKILVFIDKYGNYKYGNRLKIRCELDEPEVFNEFDYKNYLLAKGIVALCYQPEILNVEGDKIGWQKNFYISILEVKDRARKIIVRVLPYPHAEIVLALILGLSKNIPEYVNDIFSKTGTTHIVSISGSHMVVIVGLLTNLFLWLGFGRKHLFWLVCSCLLVFLMMIGFMPAAIRASIMGLMVLLALTTGRLSWSVNSLVTSATILLLINPKLVRWDIGFQLSFLAVLGIIYLYTPIERFLKKIKIPEIFQIRSVMGMTLSAQVFVLPLVVYYFGRISFVSLIANILILPILPFLLILGLVMILVGFLWLSLAQAIAWFLGFGIGYMLWILELLSKVPGGFVDLNL